MLQILIHKMKKKNKNKNRFLISILSQNDWLQWIVCMRDDLTVRHGNVPHSLKNFEICMPEFDSALFRFWLDISYQCRSSYFLKKKFTNLFVLCNEFVWMKYPNAVFKAWIVLSVLYWGCVALCNNGNRKLIRRYMY